MDLYDYFYQQKKENGTMLPQMSELIGISPGMISLIMHGHRPPSYKVARKIEIATGEKVKYVDMMVFYYNKKKMAATQKNKERPRRKRIIPQSQVQA